MIVASCVLSITLPLTTQYWNEHSFGISTTTTAFNANPPANIQDIYITSGVLGLSEYLLMKQLEYMQSL